MIAPYTFVVLALPLLALAQPAPGSVNLEAREADPRWGVQGFCHRVGQPCGKTKRDNLVGLVDYMTSEDPTVAKRDPAWGTQGFCHRVGQPCGKVKRDALLDLAEALSNEEVDNNAEVEKRSADPRWGNQGFCHRVGQPCGKKAKREAEASWGIQGFCHRVGQPCGKVKRSQLQDIVDALAETENSDVVKRNPEARWGLQGFCHRVGQPCGKVKRELSDLITHLEEAEKAAAQS
jgi:hypothetical protein